MDTCLDLECVNCAKPFCCVKGRLPFTLFCGCSSICEKCASQDLKRRKNAVVCPICGKTTRLHSGMKVREQLPPNLYLIGILTSREHGLICTPRDIQARKDTIKQHLEKKVLFTTDTAESKTAKIFCSECSEAADVSCNKCDGVYCNSCFTVVHSSSRSMRAHTSTPLTMALGVPSQCSSHPSNNHTYYCETDKTPICSDCLLKEHKDHSVLKLHQMACTYRDMLLPLMESAHTVLSSMAQTEQALENKVNDLSNQLETTANSVQTCFTLLHTSLQSTEANILRKLNKAVSLYGKGVLNARRIVQSHTVSLQSTLRRSQAALQDDYLLIREGDELLSKLREVSRMPQQLGADDSQPISFSMSPATEIFESACLTFDSEYKGPVLMSSSGLVEPDYLEFSDVESAVSSDIGVSRSATPSSQCPIVTDERLETSSRLNDVSSLSSRSSSVSKEVLTDNQPVVDTERTLERECVGVSEHRPYTSSPSPQSSPVGSSKVISQSPPVINSEGTWEVVLTHVESLDEFYVQTVDQQHKVEALMTNLAMEEHTTRSATLTPDDLYIGLYCAAKFSQDERWYRAIIVRYLGSNTVRVKYVDYGNTEDVVLSRIMWLPPSLLSIPPLCNECALANVRPFKPGAIKRNTWTRDAMKVFSDIACLELKLKVLGCNFNGILLVDLHYLTKNGYASVGATLVSKGLAVRGHKKQTEEGIPRHCTLGCGDTRQVTVPVAENPFDFFVHIEAQVEDLQELEQRIRKSTSRSLLPVGLPLKGMLCLSQYAVDRKWYRALILDVSDNGIRVLFLDYGNDELVSTVYPLGSELRVIQVQAVHCSMHNLTPLDGGDGWSEEVADFFNEYAGGRLWTMTVKGVVSRNVNDGGSYGHPLNVDLVAEDGQYLSRLLVDRGMARYKTPPARSIPDIDSSIITSASSESSLSEDQSTKSVSSQPGKLPSVSPSSRIVSQPVVARSSQSSNRSVSISPSQSSQKRSTSLSHTSNSHKPWKRPSRKSKTPPQSYAFPSLPVSTSRSSSSFTHSPQSRSPCPEIKSHRSSSVTHRAQSTRVCIPPVQLPQVGSSVTCIVTFIASDPELLLYAVFPDHEYMELNNRLSSVLKNLQSPISLNHGDICLVLFPSEQKLYRAVIVGKISPNTIRVFYVDYGNTDETVAANIYSIPDSLCQAPARAARCVLDGIEKPLSKSLLPLLYQLVSSKNLTAKINGISNSGTVSISIFHPERGDIGEALLSPQYQLSCLTSLPKGPFVIQVTAIDGDMVYGHVMDDENTRLIHEVARCVEEECRLAHPVESVEVLQPKDSVCALFYGDGTWNRATVKTVDKNKDKCEVFFIDFGNHDVVDSKDVVRLVARPEIPACAIGLIKSNAHKVFADNYYTVRLQDSAIIPPHASFEPLYY